MNDSCGSCRQCIDACPVHALTSEGFLMEKCMSYYNQTKKVLTADEIQANYSLFGCDICQMVCPKNKQIIPVHHPEFELSGKEAVSIVDLFTTSEKDFLKKYEGMAYLWKGKTILMRNALTLLLRKNQMNYNDIIEESLTKTFPGWYKMTAATILKQLKDFKRKE
jgi:epoxyqueuosine reductase